MSFYSLYFHISSTYYKRVIDTYTNITLDAELRLSFGIAAFDL